MALSARSKRTKESSISFPKNEGTPRPRRPVKDKFQRIAAGTHVAQDWHKTGTRQQYTSKISKFIQGWAFLVHMRRQMCCFVRCSGRSRNLPPLRKLACNASIATGRTSLKMALGVETLPISSVYLHHLCAPSPCNTSAEQHWHFTSTISLLQDCF